MMMLTIEFCLDGAMTQLNVVVPSVAIETFLLKIQIPKYHKANDAKPFQYICAKCEIARERAGQWTDEDGKGGQRRFDCGQFVLLQ